MIELSLQQVADAVGGRLEGADPAAVVHRPAVLDSRQAEPGALFVAVRGVHVDGHDYVAAAVRSGAVAALASRPVQAPAVLVPDTVAALGRLAARVRRRLPGVRVVGLTGSQGKTSTKDLLARLLAGLGPVVAPLGSYNNEIGVPLTVLGADAATSHLVVEMGARGDGQIR
ncbi:MAG: UDP-N-acetylmuramoyl-tripeptide--D-alanyl-D-alanine ligase, partial [Nocardioidaceae bacterium]|nr:UDP-N-acetylmuramoyl-tripeptide--D-alanyl-D-alanine ligase [Nocardioidaceae bacterium]